MRLKVLVMMAALTAAAGAKVINVPGDSATIQRGLSGALGGDTVLVADGTYPENLVWPSRDGIVLLSQDGADAAFINGRDSGRVITMNSLDYSMATRVEGFTIARGRVTGYPGNGAGVWCKGSPTFMRNHIVGNMLYTMGYGGGVYADGAPVFVGNLIAWDTIWSPGGGGWRYGAGICCTGSGLFFQNVFLENASVDTFSGGFWYGGALYLAGGTPVVFSNLFVRNQNGAGNGGFAYGGALYVDAGSAYVVNNTFVANKCTTAVPYGGAMYVNLSRTLTIKNNVISGNIACGIAPFGGGIAQTMDTLDTLEFGYNDVWNNTPNNYYWCRPGATAISSDPLFAVGPYGEYFLSQTGAGQDSTSPCVDAGDTLLMTEPIDVTQMLQEWTTRTDTIHDVGPLDMGYHYTPTAMTAIIQNSRSPIQNPSCLLQIVPSIVRDRAAIRYDVRLAGRAEISLLDVAGRRVATLFSGEQKAGRQTLLLSRSLTPGVYFVRARFACSERTVRFAVIR